MQNLLKETVAILQEHKLTPNDVLWIGNRTEYTDWNNFAKIADVEYDAGFGGAEVATDLIIVGKSWWLERHEYDGSEWWEYKEQPVKPQSKVELHKIIGGCWSTIDDIRNAL
jgi:hypothetical protein